MTRHSPGQAMATLAMAYTLPSEVAHQRVVGAWSQTLFRALGRVWEQLDTAERLAYEDTVSAQVHVLEDVTASLAWLSDTLERTCRRLYRHLQALRSSNAVVAPTLMP